MQRYKVYFQNSWKYSPYLYLSNKEYMQPWKFNLFSQCRSVSFHQRMTPFSGIEPCRAERDTNYDVVAILADHEMHTLSGNVPIEL